MPNEFSGKGRVRPDLSSRVRQGMQRKLEGQALISRVHTTLLAQAGLGESRKCRRIETLHLGITEDNMRWQMLFNDPERYEVISCKTSTTPSGRTISIVEYNEIGDDLPAAKTLQQLRGEDQDSEE